MAVQALVDAPAQLWPRLLGQVEIAAEVEQRALADLVAVALVVHEAVRVVVLPAGAAGEGSADEHGW